MKNHKVVVAGHVCLDIIPKFGCKNVDRLSNVLAPGKLVNVGAAMLSTGGAVANTGIAMKILGNSVSFVAKVGADAFGKIVREKMAVHGNVNGIRVDTKSTTSYSIVLAIPGIDRMFLHDSGANDTFTSSDVDYNVVKTAELFHFGYPPLMKNMYVNNGKELAAMFRRVKRCGVTTSLDMAMPDLASAVGKVDWRKVLAAVLPYVDICVPSIEETVAMMERGKYLELVKKNPGKELVNVIPVELYTTIADKMLDMGAGIVVLKAGHKGYYIRTAGSKRLEKIGILNRGGITNWSDRELWCPAFEVTKIASATGSGDTSIAGFLTSVLNGYTIEQSLKYANAVGYQNLQGLDAVSSIQPWNVVQKQVKKLISVHLDFPKNSGWTWDNEIQMWNKDKR